jgi:thiol:disulfide interchange protein
VRLLILILFLVLPCFTDTHSIHCLTLTAAMQSHQGYVTPTKFDPDSDSSQDLSAAIEEAKRTKRNVLIEVGGEWCEWCHIMDSFYAKNPDLLSLRDTNYVLVKVDVSEGHPNAEFLSRFPKIDGVPHIFILDSNGKLLHSEDTSELEEGETYNLKRFKKFLEKFAPRKALQVVNS